MDIEKSFVTTSYNTGERLKKCLNSLLPYLKDNDEMVLIDNFSNLETQNSICWASDNFKNFQARLIKSNRGKGFDFGCRVSRGRFIIVFGSDVIFRREFFDLVDKWLGTEESKTKALLGYCFWIFPRDLYFSFGGFPHSNTSEDMRSLEVLNSMDRIMYYPKHLGDNWSQPGNPDGRFEKKRKKIFWRQFIGWKDLIRMQRSKNYKSWLVKAFKFSRGNKKFYLIWAPLITMLYSYRLFRKKWKPVNLKKIEWYPNGGD